MRNFDLDISLAQLKNMYYCIRRKFIKVVTIKCFSIVFTTAHKNAH